MTQILSPLPPDQTFRILCAYQNTSSHIQIIRISNISDWYFERVVFPGERLLFESVPEANLEVYSGKHVGAMVMDTLSCQSLQVQQKTDVALR